ncbi:hypothetical protein PCE1_003207 [Barthelona sp. PCE]
MSSEVVQETSLPAPMFTTPFKSKNTISNAKPISGASKPPMLSPLFSLNSSRPKIVHSTTHIDAKKNSQLFGADISNEMVYTSTALTCCSKCDRFPCIDAFSSDIGNVVCGKCKEAFDHGKEEYHRIRTRLPKWFLKMIVEQGSVKEADVLSVIAYTQRSAC